MLSAVYTIRLATFAVFYGDDNNNDDDSIVFFFDDDDDDDGFFFCFAPYPSNASIVICFSLQSQLSKKM